MIWVSFLCYGETISINIIMISNGFSKTLLRETGESLGVRRPRDRLMPNYRGGNLQIRSLSDFWQYFNFIPWM